MVQLEEGTRVENGAVLLEEDLLEAQTRMAKILLMADDSDRETVVSSGTEDSEAEKEKDWIRGFAQRATEPDFKYRMTKGTFMFVKPALKPGRHFYINEEIQQIQDKLAEQRLRHELKGKQFHVCGVVQYDDRGRPVGFDVDQVKPAAPETAGNPTGSQHSSPKQGNSRSSSIRNSGKDPAEEKLDSTDRQLPQQAFPAEASKTAQSTPVKDAAALDVKGFAAGSSMVLEAVTTAVEAALTSPAKLQQPIAQQPNQQQTENNLQKTEHQNHDSNEGKARQVDEDAKHEDKDSNRKRIRNSGMRERRRSVEERNRDRGVDRKASRHERHRDGSRERRRHRDRDGHEDVAQPRERRSPHRRERRRRSHERQVSHRERTEPSHDRHHRPRRDPENEHHRRRSGSLQRHGHRDRRREDSRRPKRGATSHTRDSRRQRDRDHDRAEGRQRPAPRRQHREKEAEKEGRLPKGRARETSDLDGSEDERPKQRVERAARKPYKATPKDEDGSVASKDEVLPADYGPPGRYPAVPQGIDLTGSENEDVDDDSDWGEQEKGEPAPEIRVTRKDMSLRDRMRQRKLQVYSTSEEDEDVVKIRRAAQDKKRAELKQSNQTPAKKASTNDSDEDERENESDVQESMDDEKASQASTVRERSRGASVAGSQRGSVTADPNGGITSKSAVMKRTARAPVDSEESD